MSRPKKTISDDELAKRGWSIPIYRAVQAAGGDVPVAYEFRLATSNTVQAWYARRTLPLANVHRLCELGGMEIKPVDILSDIAAHQAEKVAA